MSLPLSFLLKLVLAVAPEGPLDVQIAQRPTNFHEETHLERDFLLLDHDTPWSDIVK